MVTGGPSGSGGLGSLLLPAFRDHRDLAAFTNWEGETITYGEAAARISRLRALLRAAGVGPGDRVALLGRNATNWALTYLAAVMHGAAVVPILPDFRPDDVAHVLAHSGASILFAAPGLVSPVDTSGTAGLAATVSLHDFSVLRARKGTDAAALAVAFSATPGPLAAEARGAQDVAAIVYTSGTTGFSKGVVLPHRSLVSNVLYARRNMPLVPAERICSFLPLAHAFGCAFEFLFPVSAGCHITFLDRTPSPAVLLKAFAEVKPRLILTVPLVLEKIWAKKLKPVLEKPATKFLASIPGVRQILFGKVRDKLTDVFGSTFREIVVGAAALNPEVERFFLEAGFRFTCGYGMTECGPLITYCGWKSHRFGSVGPVVDGLEMKIDSPDPRSVPGEVLVRGENVMLGYWNAPEATAEVLSPDGWLRTGDLGTMDAEGHLTLRGRRKAMLLGASGQNVYPEEVEAVMNTLPLVGESLLVDRAGKLVILAWPDPDAVSAEGLTREKVREEMEKNRRELNRRLPVYSQPVRVEVVDEEFQKTPTRKIKRFLYGT